MNRRSTVPMGLSAVLLVSFTWLGWLKLRMWPVETPLLLGGSVAVAYVLWMCRETAISLRDSKQATVRADRWTAEVYALSQGSTALSALWFESRWPVASLLCMSCGTVVFVLGVLLRLAAVRELGRFYSHRVQVAGDHHIVQTGPYRYLRHPAYLGMLTLHLGLVLVFFNWVSLALLLGALLPAIVLRIRIEEQALLAVPDYAQFCLGRSRLVPWVW